MPTPKAISRIAAQLGARGGHARAARMTPEERKAAARLAASFPRPSRKKKTAPEK